MSPFPTDVIHRLRLIEITILIWYLSIIQAITSKMGPLLLDQLSEQINLCLSAVWAKVHSNDDTNFAGYTLYLQETYMYVML